MVKRIFEERTPAGWSAAAQHGEDANHAPASAEIYLTERQYCDRYHVAPRTAQRWRVTGEGPPFVRLGRHKIVYRLSDVEQWARARTFSHRADELSRLQSDATPTSENKRG